MYSPGTHSGTWLVRKPYQQVTAVAPWTVKPSSQLRSTRDSWLIRSSEERGSPRCIHTPLFTSGRGQDTAERGGEGERGGMELVFVIVVVIKY